MSGKSFAVIGLGQFGMTLAKELANADYDVLAIDDKDENIQEIADTVTYAVRADVREPGILKSLGVQNVDVAIIAVAENMEASITATMQVKDLGVPLVLAKAMNSLHGRILEKIGADQVIYPERSMGISVARNFTASGFEDVFELSTEFSMAEFRIPGEWVGKSLSEIRLREQHHINLVAVKHGDSVNVNLNPAEKLDGTLVTLNGKQYIKFATGSFSPFALVYQKESGGGDHGGGGGTTYYTLRYESNGGTKYKDERYRRNTLVELDKEHVREGYTFTGRYAAKALTEPIDDIPMTPNKTA